jgi:uncharacterized coiled-coil protein SlyX
MKKLSVSTLIIIFLVISSIGLCAGKEHQEKKIDHINAMVVNMNGSMNKMNRDMDTIIQITDNSNKILDKITEDRQARFEDRIYQMEHNIGSPMMFIPK